MGALHWLWNTKLYYYYLLHLILHETNRSFEAVLVNNFLSQLNRVESPAVYRLCAYRCYAIIVHNAAYLIGQGIHIFFSSTIEPGICFI